MQIPASNLPFVDMPTDWSRALAVVAHPDDLEYGAAAAIARWTDEGRRVSYLLLTRGEAGIDTMEPADAARVRMGEQRASAAIVGVDQVDFLDHPDGLLEYGIDLRRDIAGVIRRVQPELLITVNHHDVFPGGFINMADHRVAGLAAIDAVRDAANRWLFPEQGEPWSGVRYVAIGGSPYASHAVDVASTLDRAVASLQAHSSYLEALGEHPMADAETFLRGGAEAAGARFGDRPAAAFELLEL